MKLSSPRRGSALLIVLGMLSFMVISAVAFAAFMRYTRLPSSYLRRTSSTRQLVKAALAEAIETVDRAINNNPHPGIGTASTALTGGRSRNHWANHVFIGTNVPPESVDEANTVSPLCVEALAYMPPALVNAARYYSRHSPSAHWQSMGFDAGRFVWCALDVSDYFDINRLVANERRSSAGPRLITLASNFEDLEHTRAADASATRKWDDFMKEYRGDFDQKTLRFKDIKSEYPLISMADFNLALYDYGDIGKFKSPFCSYFKPGGSESGWEDAGANSSTELNKTTVARMTYVTDSLYAPEDEELRRSDDFFDLSNSEDQPFPLSRMKKESPLNFGALVENEDGLNDDMWARWLSGLGVANLADYLDEDSVPLSLAIPTTERIAMICGIQPQGGSKQSVAIKMTIQSHEEEMGDGFVHCTYVVQFGIDGETFVGALPQAFKAIVVYPFSHVDESEGRTYEMDGQFSMFLSSGDAMGLRTGNANDVIHVSKGEFKDMRGEGGAGLFSASMQKSSVSFSDSIKKPSECVNAVKAKAMTMNDVRSWASTFSNKKLFTLTYDWKYKAKEGSVTVPNAGPRWDDVKANPGLCAQNQGSFTAVCNFAPLLRDGTIDPDYKNNFQTLMEQGYNLNKPLRFNGAVWLKLKHTRDGEVVDMVPACYNDDAMLAGRVMGGGRIGNQISGDPYPLMRMDGSDAFNINIGDMIKNGTEEMTVDVEFKFAGCAAGDGVICGDPRFNHAPENWFKCSDVSEQGWIDNCGAKDRDGDIFMATSDAGYLQSKYELAFLPAIAALKGNGGLSGNLHSPSRYDGTRGFPQAIGDCANGEFMWTTYSPYAAYRDDSAAFNDLNIVGGGGGFRVNPYSDTTNVILSVFLNTPLDWRYASTNDTQALRDAGILNMKAKEFNEDYAWNSYGAADAQIDWEDFEGLASTFISTMRNAKNDPEEWKTLWKNMDWDYEEKSLWGRTLAGNTSEIWTADRKYFYGYWSECFAARQQLFLIFVRAEPAMMGGEGQTPPQLGARAVALVWRDPTKAEDPLYPHQTRILFYRQFE